MIKKTYESFGIRNGYPIICPTYDLSCPYCDGDGKCRIENPVEECDDFATFFPTWEEWDEEFLNEKED